MTLNTSDAPFSASSILKLVTDERAKALSVREWKHRLAGYGYAIKDTEAGHVVTELFGKAELCVLPSEAAVLT